MVLTSILALGITKCQECVPARERKYRKQAKVKADEIIERHHDTLKNALYMLKESADEMTKMNVDSCVNDLESILRKPSTVLMSW